jgi:beta-N-acetylhexosaminidase
VNSNPRNPVIGVRSFGSEPELVARHVAAFVTGAQEHGVAACAKHFPGHGDTAVDSHLELPVVDEDRETLIAGPLRPFAAAVDAGVAAIMTAHILVPALDTVAATLSEPVVTGLLRRELGFDGAIVSDALEMKAISAGVGIEEGAVRAVAAGVDALCIGHDVDDGLVARVHGALVQAVSSGRLRSERLEEAAAAVTHLGGFTAVAASNGAPDPAIGVEAARRALRVRGDVALDGAPLVVELEPPPMVAAGPAAHTLGSEIGARRPATDVVSLHEGTRDLSALARSAEGRPLVLVLRDAARHPWQRDTASGLIQLRPDAVVVETGLPGWTPRGATAYIETFGAGRVSLSAAADLLVPS